MCTTSHVHAASATSLLPCTFCIPPLLCLKAAHIAAQHLEATKLFSSFPIDCACSFYDFDAPIYTMSRFLPPSKVADAEISDSILGDGTVIRAGCNIKHSVIGLRTLINENCTVEDALVSHAFEMKTC